MSAFFDDIKSDKKSAVNDFLIYIGYTFPDDLIRTDNPLWLLGIPPFSAETHFFVVDLFLKLVKKSNWSEHDKRIWIDRYVLNKPSKYVAKRVKNSSAWVNSRFYRCKQKLAKMVKVWWNERLADNPEETLPKLLDAYIKEHCRNIKVNYQINIQTYEDKNFQSHYH